MAKENVKNSGSSNEPAKPRGSRKIILGAVVVSFIAGLGLGGYGWSQLNPTAGSASTVRTDSTAPGGPPSLAVSPESNTQEIRIGKLTLSLQSDRDGSASDRRHMLITPIVVFETGENAGAGIPGISAPSEAQTEMRDVFIEYLSQLTYRDISGSAGMSMIRADLKRRAQKLYPNSTVNRVLLQDYLIQ